MPEPSALLAAALPAALSVAAGAVVAAALGAVVAVLLLDRWRSDVSGTRTTPDEVRSILTRIERTLAEQRHQAETERRVLAQKLEGVRRAIAHGAAVARGGAPRSAGSREAEADEVRRQIEAAQGGAAPPAQGAAPWAPVAESVAGATAAAEPPPAPPLATGPPAPRAEAFMPPALDVSELAPSATKAKAPAPDEAEEPRNAGPESGAVTPEPDAPAAGVPEADASETDAGGASPADVRFAPDAVPAPADAAGDGLAGGAAVAEPSGLFEPMSFAAPPAPPTDDSAWVARPADAAADVRPAEPPPAAAAPADEPALDDVVIPAEPPEGAEDLTVVRSIDAETQAHLYGSGVLTLDDIARLGKSDAQRIERELGIPEQTVTGQWVFEAQALLFDRFSAQGAV